MTVRHYSIAISPVTSSVPFPAAIFAGGCLRALWALMGLESGSAKCEKVNYPVLSTLQRTNRLFGPNLGLKEN